jgi:hypothetical protein
VGYQRFINDLSVDELTSLLKTFRYVGSPNPTADEFATVLDSLTHTRRAVVLSSTLLFVR